MSDARPAPEPPVVVVVAYGDPNLLEHCLATLGVSFPVLVVDNGRDKEVARICVEREARYLLPTRNLGFAAGVNRALAQVRPGRDVLLLNPDAALMPADLIVMQRELHAPGPRRAAVAPRLKRSDGSMEPTSWPIPSPASVWAGVIGLAGKLGSHVEFLTGAVLLLSGEALEEVGVFDERFFLYTEEADWQLRAQRAGWEISPCLSVTAEHRGGATSTDSRLREVLFHGSAELFARKWYGVHGWWLFRAGSLLAALRRLAVTRSRENRSRQWQLMRLYLRGPVRCLPPSARPSLWRALP